MAVRDPAPVVPLRPLAPAHPQAELDDEALMLLAAAGRRDAFAALARRHLPALARFCAKLVADGPLGEEVAQDALLDVWAGRQRYRRGNVRVHLLTVARHRCLNQLRDARRHARWVEPAADPEPAGGASAARPDPLEELLEAERTRGVLRALAVLPPKLREAVLLRYDQGLEYPEIARVVGRGESTVRSRVMLGLRRLRAALGDEGEP
jgi:RNA polymerase sigma-70 factor (ECF subfamily)